MFNLFKNIVRSVDRNVHILVQTNKDLLVLLDHLSVSLAAKYFPGRLHNRHRGVITQHNKPGMAYHVGSHSSDFSVGPISISDNPHGTEFVVFLLLDPKDHNGLFTNAFLQQ